LALAAVLALPVGGHAQQHEPSFAGKQIRLLIGYSPTSYGYDTYGRLLARYLGKYLPGNPLIVPQNRPGAGSLNLTSYMAHAAPADGSEIAIVGRGVAMEPIEMAVEGLPLQELQLCPSCYLVMWSDEEGIHARQGVPMERDVHPRAEPGLVVGEPKKC